MPNFLSMIDSSLSFGITTIESLSFLSSSSPALASFSLFGASNIKGFVTIDIVNASTSLAIFAIIGAAPVPVPPPRPAEINTISAPVSAFFISS